MGAVHRPDRLEARWIQPHYQRPAWGKAPPEVGRSPAPTAVAPLSKKKPEKEPLVQAMGTPRMDPEAPHPLPAGTPDAGLTDPIPDLVLDHLAPGLGLLAKILGPVEAVSTLSSAPAPPTPGSVPPPPASAGPDDREGVGEGPDEEREP